MTTTGDAAPLRLSMTLPGSASLGAFQAGAVSALAVVIQTLRETGRGVRLDAVGGASAGSIVAMLFTHCLMTGRDAPALLRRAWIDEVDVELLRCGGSAAPLAFDDLRERMVSLLEDGERHPTGVHATLEAPVTIEVALTSLLGFVRPVDIAGGRVPTLTYADWVSYELTPGGGLDELIEPQGASLLDAVLVSASHPGAFSPRTFALEGDADRHERRGVEGLPEAAVGWYTDGGLVESRPVGRVIRAARRRAGAAGTTRLHLVVDPRSSGPSGSDPWADPRARRSWIDGVRRSLSILPTQALHDDLRDVADVNRRITAVEESTDRLADRLGPDADREELRSELAALADVDGKEYVDLDVVSPLVQARESDDGVSDLLAGDFIGAFGGFLDTGIRRNDFVLGWASTKGWLPQAFERHGVDDERRDAVLTELDRRRRHDWSEVALSEEGIDHLDRSGRWQLALLAAQAGRVLVSEALPGRSRDGSEPRHPFLTRGRPRILAHRGARARFPPGNTWAAFEAALEAGVDHLETDVQVSADGRVVVFHDERLDGATDGTGTVADHPWSALSEIRYRNGDDEGLVLLDDLLERLDGAFFNIDVKTDEAVAPTVRVLRRHAARERVCVAAFSWSRLRRLRDALGPGWCTAVPKVGIAAARLASWAHLPVRGDGDVAQVPREHRGVTVVDRDFVAALHAGGTAVHVWTVDDVAEMERLFDLGVDGVITDRPEVLARAL